MRPMLAAAALLTAIFPPLAAANAASAESSRDARSSQDAGSSRGWELQRKLEDPRDGYALYARPHPGSDYAEYRLEVPVDGGKEEVIAALEHNMLDPDTYPEGFQRKLLRREQGVVVTYDYIEVPFVSDRDVVIRTEIERGAEPGQPSIHWRAIEGEGPAPRDGVVRMPSSQGTWTITASGGRTLAVYEAHVELGGSMPAAIVESRMPDEIAELAVNLRRTMRERRLAQR